MLETSSLETLKDLDGSHVGNHLIMRRVEFFLWVYLHHGPFVTGDHDDNQKKPSHTCRTPCCKPWHSQCQEHRNRHLGHQLSAWIGTRGVPRATSSPKWNGQKLKCFCGFKPALPSYFEPWSPCWRLAGLGSSGR